MDKKQISGIGDEIKDIVQNAVSTMDFRQLNKDITNTVNSALNEFHHAIKGANLDFGQTFSKEREGRNQEPRELENTNRQNRTYTQSRTNTQNNRISNNSSQPQRPVKRLPINTQVGKVSGILYTVFGSIGMGVLGIAIVVLAVVGSVLGIQETFAMIIAGLLPFLGISFIMNLKGANLRNRIKRLRRYAEIAKGRNYCTIKELSNRTGFGKKYIIKDIKKMVALGMILEGNLDEQETCVMFDREAYDLYLTAKHNQEERENKKIEEVPVLKSEIDEVLSQGENYINEIERSGSFISSQEVKLKLEQMEGVIRKILNYIKNHPGQLHEISKFTDYYLPTTLKLLNAYIQFEHQAVQSESIQGAKKEIEDTLDTINNAFENLLDDLFENIVMDVSSDISVLQTILTQEGLTEGDFFGSKE